MNRPVRTGFLFGVGFSLVFVMATVVLSIAAEYFVDSLFSEFDTEDAKYGEPSVVRTEAVTRGSHKVVLVTVHNPTDESLRFHAEAVMFDAKGAFLETCSADREYIVKGGDDLSFKAECPTYGEEQVAAYEEVSEIELQFFEKY